MTTVTIQDTDSYKSGKCMRSHAFVTFLSNEIVMEEREYNIADRAESCRMVADIRDWCQHTKLPR